jgi:hypothetical protein
MSQILNQIKEVKKDKMKNLNNRIRIERKNKDKKKLGEDKWKGHQTFRSLKLMKLKINTNSMRVIKLSNNQEL